uniref:Uncharacterized protein n=1 Tax=Glossina austeni TaxID=7395 RepID=A0A1A9VFD8_GLOAU
MKMIQRSQKEKQQENIIFGPLQAECNCVFQIAIPSLFKNRLSKLTSSFDGGNTYNSSKWTQVSPVVRILSICHHISPKEIERNHLFFLLSHASSLIYFSGSFFDHGLMDMD